ncbi:Hsp33 family molecular chaperone [Bradyrhizobium sp. 180]|jgi:molecular chaperone Hsp33|uniref:Hsp33 family molecular chaperone n=1 Tax=unclassified Bradyrhizobium TaxID=2631580 RepID=UPI001FFB3863|nr:MULTISPECIES: Hsp33 family molecular chaperone [unclassified Bradyrhizobium]MCK1425506.1 Hsp33 family molecular chaperone [Bradyrhizobium sp. CW12]MCK1493956.1 Hsp33 family molecular chaperone [Bradyrhizobium sp. 180]MCK1532063.1 Hsp33 family molecular chaperone [Bradyrhizobium sp. 182]MCK1594398.1 Hsp33 family molecular chaperone [Bradyrhizobium sp. 164]MCK1644489.1 Hsp33 family molecular chaperone [Bradyrhizobium sp. 154]
MVSQSPDMKTGPEGPVRAPSPVPIDDAVLPYEVDALDVRGRLVRLGPALDDILTKHDYPAPVGKLLGEAIVLTTLLGSALKFEGRFILQAQTDGPVSFLVVDYMAPDRLRAYARFDAARLGNAKDSGTLLGRGHLAMTIDQGPDMSRYQGLVALDGGSLEEAAHEYFLRSEQIPTRVRLAVGEEWRSSDGGKHRWRAGGMLMQFLPKAPERARQADLHPGDAPEGSEVHSVAEDDAWVEARSLIETVEDVELIDPELSGERLLFRLFHERGVRVFNSQVLEARCSCSRDAVASMLKSFSPDDRAAMVKDDKVVVTCEFCSSVYQFTPHEAGVEDA